MGDYKNFYNDNFENRGGNGREFGNIEGSFAYFKKVNLPKNAVILDVGCNFGSLVNKLHRAGYKETLGIDISDKAIDAGRKAYPDIADRLITYEGDKLPFEDSTFDAVLMFDAIEHIPEIEKFIEQEIRRVLRRDGKFIFQTPNKYINILWTYIDARSIFAQWWVEHCSLQTIWSLRKILTKATFSEIKIEKGLINSEYNRMKMRNKFGKLGWLLLKFSEKLPLFLYPSLFGSAKK